MPALRATPASNRARSTTNRSCWPAQIRSAASWASAEKRRRRPCTASSTTRATTSIPGGVAASWLRSMWTPSDISSSSRCGATASMHAHSISPTMNPVANTSGIAANAGDSG